LNKTEFAWGPTAPNSHQTDLPHAFRRHLVTIGGEAKLTAWWRCGKDCLASPGPCRQAFLASG